MAPHTLILKARPKTLTTPNPNEMCYLLAHPSTTCPSPFEGQFPKLTCGFMIIMIEPNLRGSKTYLGYCPHPGTVYDRGNLNRLHINIFYLSSNCYRAGGGGRGGVYKAYPTASASV